MFVMCVLLSLHNYAAMLTYPENFTVMIVDPSTDSDPVTATFSWTALDNVTVDGQDITYTVIVTYNNEDTIIANASISHPNDTLEISNLPACADLTATLTAMRGNESSNGTVRGFSTSEPNSEYYRFCTEIKEERPFSSASHSIRCHARDVYLGMLPIKRHLLS